jgi:hypothetical protein
MKALEAEEKRFPLPGGLLPQLQAHPDFLRSYLPIAEKEDDVSKKIAMNRKSTISPRSIHEPLFLSSLPLKRSGHREGKAHAIPDKSVSHPV